MVAIGLRDSSYFCRTGRLRCGSAALRMALKQAYHLVTSKGAPFVSGGEGQTCVDCAKMVENPHALLYSAPPIRFMFVELIKARED